MIQKIIYYGHPILRKKAALIDTITDEIKQLAADMIETMLHLDDGIGLAAPQVGKSLALFVVQFPHDDSREEEYIPGNIEVFINPKLLEVSDEMDLYAEGCLSIPNVYKKVLRPTKIKVQAQNLAGERFVREYEGFKARMILHENDHLNGVLFIDKLKAKERKALKHTLKASFIKSGIS